jgi:hypothetical protein
VTEPTEERVVPEARMSMGKDDPSNKKKPAMGKRDEAAIPQQSRPKGMKTGEQAVDPLGCTWGVSQPGVVVRHAVMK